MTVETTRRRVDRAKITSRCRKNRESDRKIAPVTTEEVEDTEEAGKGEREKREGGVCPKNSGSLHTTCFSLFRVSRPLLQPVRDCPRSGIKRRTINGEQAEENARGSGQGPGGWEGGWSSGRTKKYGKKKKSRVGEGEQEGREERGTPKLFGVIAVRSRFSLCSCLFCATFSSSRAFFFFSSSHCCFKHSFEQVRPPCFSSSACTYRLVCVQATFACSDRERGKQRERDGLKSRGKRGEGGTRKRK